MKEQSRIALRVLCTEKLTTCEGTHVDDKKSSSSLSLNEKVWLRDPGRYDITYVCIVTPIVRKISQGFYDKKLNSTVKRIVYV